MATSGSISRAELVRITKFGAVGAINTVIDFVIYNLASSELGLSLVVANLISTTVAMVFSYFANRQVVFAKSKSTRPLHHQLALFYIISAFGVYVLQSLVIVLLTTWWPWPLDHLLTLLHLTGSHTSSAFVTKNAAKAVATIVSLTWNYIMYKKVVFK